MGRGVQPPCEQPRQALLIPPPGSCVFLEQISRVADVLHSHGPPCGNEYRITVSNERSRGQVMKESVAIIYISSLWNGDLRIGLGLDNYSHRSRYGH
jgi:hypothetical protein